MNRSTIIIDNLKCGGCANTVTKQLQAIEGVESVHVDLENSAVEIEKDESVSEESLIKKLSKLGYPPAGTSNFVQKAKSYVSCAIGRLDK